MWHACLRNRQRGMHIPFWPWILKNSDQSRNFDVVKILKWTYSGVRIWTWFCWLRIWSSSGLQTQKWTSWYSCHFGLLLGLHFNLENRRTTFLWSIIMLSNLNISSSSKTENPLISWATVSFSSMELITWYEEWLLLGCYTLWLL
jgi:hypothetical protein